MKELATPYKKWLDEDVAYIISPTERKSFLQLQTNEEREQFIEQFWQRRNPDPDSTDNPVKEEHYRRIAYANEHFSSGMPGWKTDRGRIYIIWGKPDSLETHTLGETWEPADGSRRRTRPRRTRTKIGRTTKWRGSGRASWWSSWIRPERVSSS